MSHVVTVLDVEIEHIAGGGFGYAYLPAYIAVRGVCEEGKFTIRNIRDLPSGVRIKNKLVKIKTVFAPLIGTAMTVQVRHYRREGQEKPYKSVMTASPSSLPNWVRGNWETIIQ